MVKKDEGTEKMKPIIIYASMHHGNTKKIVDAIAKEYGVETVDATTVREKDLSGYDLIGFASGIYAGRFHPDVAEFARKNLPNGSRIFYIMTSAMNRDFSRSMDNMLKDKQATVVGRFFCKGYNTFGPFRLVGGTGKGHPDNTDLKNAVTFYKGLIN